jgi:glycosyltransferase involved in cell wall biosynthesis
MGLKDREDILVADDPGDFARAIIELYKSEELWNRLSENGIEKTRALYSTDTARKKLEFLFSDDHLKSAERPTDLEKTEIALAERN